MSTIIARRMAGKRAIRGHTTFAVVLTLVAMSRAARSDRYEAQWSARPVVGFAQMREEGAGTERTAAGGLSLGLSYGWSNNFDLGVELVTVTTMMPRFSGASIVLDGGAEVHGVLTRRASTALLMLGPTWRFGVAWVPVISLAAGGGVRVRSAGRFPDLDIAPEEKAMATVLDLGATARIGIERRVNRRLTVGGYVSAIAAWSPSAPLLPMATVSVGLSYVNYPLW